MSKAMALVGDWNATPHDSGRYSPSWLAAQTGLRIHSSGPGRHGDIDYAMADCHVYGAERHAPPAGASRSDHDAVSFTLYHPEAAGDRWLTLVTWNLRYGRPPAVVRAQVAQLLRELQPDVLALQEAADYHRVLSTLPGYRLVAYEGHGRMHNVLLVRDGHQLRRPRLLRLSPRGWRLSDGTGAHAPLYATSVVVDWLRVVVVHLPPSVNWRHGVPTGPLMRVAALVAAVSKLRRRVLANRRKRRP